MMDGVVSATTTTNQLENGSYTRANNSYFMPKSITTKLMRWLVVVLPVFIFGIIVFVTIVIFVFEIASNSNNNNNNTNPNGTNNGFNHNNTSNITNITNISTLWSVDSKKQTNVANTIYIFEHFGTYFFK